MGTVHEAEDEATGERVAVKLIHKSRLSGRRAAEAVGRFRREARAAAAASGANVVRVIEDGVDEATGDLFIIMELLEGEDLQQILQRTGPLAAPLALRVVGQALQGLQKAHEAGIVHRDIKPANLFLAREGAGEMVVKILDFGIAKMMGDGDGMKGGQGLTTTGHFLGSPLFMSPEQVKNSKHVDLRADLWAIGSVLYCALAGRAPHEAEIESAGKLILAICHTPARPVHEIAPWVPVPVSEVLQRALSIDPRGRYASAAEMLHALRPFAPDLALRQDMWNDLPVLVTVPPPRPDDGEHDAGEHIAMAETLPQLGASLRLPASAESTASFLKKRSLRLPDEGLAETMEAPPRDAPPRDPTPPDRPALDDREEEPALREAPLDRPASSSASPEPRGGGGRRRGIMALGAVLVAGGAAALFLKSTPASTQADHHAPPSSSVALSSRSSAGVSPEPLRFQLRVAPAGATVSVDGAEVKPIAGAVELTGAPGTTHDVQLSGEGGTLRTSVSITEKGLLPPEIELTAPPPPPPSAPPSAGARSPLARSSAISKDPPAPTGQAPPVEPPVPLKPLEDDLMHDHR